MNIAIRRLRNQHLAGRGLAQPADVVRHLAAVQSQDYRGAIWALAQRCGLPTAAAVEAAVASGAILRTHVLRPTWHFVVAEDIRWMLALTAPRVIAGNAGRYRELGLDQQTFKRSRSALEKALAGGVAMTRAEAAGVLSAAGLRLDAQRLPHLLGEAELGGVICSGPPVGKTQTFALLEERVPPVPALDSDAAAAELATRYFVSHGPARIADFTWWSSLTVAQTRRAIESAGARLATDMVDGRPVWFAPDEPRSRVASPFVRLLPNYDEYVVAYRERTEYYDCTLDPVVFRGGVMANIVALDGRAVGNWRRQPKGRSVELVVESWLDFDDTVWDAVATEVGKLERHLEQPVELVARRRN
jgi:hypothetical protein